MFCACLFSMLAACALLPAPDGDERAEALAGAAGWQRQWLATESFPLLAYVPATLPLDRAVLSIYIEGDGRAWLSKRRISPDPTPRDPLALKLALRHPSDRAAAYLARPCQYGGRAHRPPCRSEYWAGKRFGSAVMAASQTAVDRLKRRFGAQKVVLIGYSGGGAIAALLAAGRRDVAGVITVAGNLDHRTWTGHHRVTPLGGSRNPADEWRALREVPQYHLAGEEDRIVPPLVTRAYQRRFPPEERPPMRVIPGFDHHCCWHANWPALLEGIPWNGGLLGAG